MRLLDCSGNDFVLTKILVAPKIPRYAILSHTWGPESDEVTFNDLNNGTGKEKIGYEKIKFCAAQARRDGLRYFWMDTCCINKANNAELSSSINAMFRWYQNAARCYVYLSDVPDTQRPELDWRLAFQASRWFTRGWTLQELLAPTIVEFFTKEGQRLGDKSELEQEIHETTGVAIPAIRGSALTQFSIKERFQWAEKRQTTREEDWAYCLQGIFGTSMSLIYDEGKQKAVHRLEREINSTPTMYFLQILFPLGPNMSRADMILAENEECRKHLRSTDPLNDKKRIEHMKGGLLRDSYKWILGNDDFLRWHNEDKSRLLYIRGKRGIGKTMLLCGIIDELMSGPAINVSYFFCQATGPYSNTAELVLRGLIYQLVDQQPSLISHVRAQYDLAGKDLFEDANAWFALSAIFSRIIQDPDVSTTYLIIDALDQCPRSQRLQLLGLVTDPSFCSANLANIKWLISSRPGAGIEEKLIHCTQGYHLLLKLQQDLISTAVQTYIGHKVDQLARIKGYDEELRSHVDQYLVSHADSSFLWVAMVCQDLARPEIREEDTRTKLHRTHSPARLGSSKLFICVEGNSNKALPILRYLNLSEEQSDEKLVAGIFEQYEQARKGDHWTILMLLPTWVRGWSERRWMLPWISKWWGYLEIDLGAPLYIPDTADFVQVSVQFLPFSTSTTFLSSFLLLCIPRSFHGAVQSRAKTSACSVYSMGDFMITDSYG